MAEEQSKCTWNLKQWWGPRNFQEWKNEVLAAIVVCFAQIPESVAFAALANCPAAVGLHAAWIVGLVCALFGGRPGMINGSAGALASVTCQFVTRTAHPGPDGTTTYAYEGLENLFISVMLAGAIIMVCGAFKIGRFLTLVPATVMIGFCNGLAIVIGLGQAMWWQGAGDEWVQGAVLTCTLVHSAVALILMYSLPRITKQMPASLICIIVGCLLEYALFRPAFDVHTLTIHDKSGFSKDDAVPLPFFLNHSYDLGKINFGRDVITQAVTLAVVAMLESLMCLEVMNDVTGTVGQPNRQVWALGAANVLAGLFGTMGGNSLIELCVMNVQARGTMRASSTIVALGVLAVVLFASNVLNLLPCGTLGGIMITVVIDTARWSSVPAMIASVTPQRLLQRDNEVMRKLNGLKIDRFDSFVIIVVTALTFFFNLMVSVGAGMFLATLRFAWQAQQPLDVEAVVLPETPDVKVYRIRGNLFFASKEKLACAFDFENDPGHIQIDFSESKIFDFSVLHAFHGVLERYHSMDKQVSVVNLRDATHLHHLMYFGAVKGVTDKETAITASLISGAASFKM